MPDEPRALEFSAKYKAEHGAIFKRRDSNQNADNSPSVFLTVVAIAIVFGVFVLLFRAFTSTESISQTFQFNALFNIRQKSSVP